MPEISRHPSPQSPARRGNLEEAAASYLAHVVEGRSIRSIAQKTNVHPSTIMRRIRKIEGMRDDPVLDQYLSHAPRVAPTPKPVPKPKTSDPVLGAPEKVLLRRLSETGAMLVVSRGMEKAVVLRTTRDGDQTRTAVLDAELAGAAVLRDWIRPTRTGGKVSCYKITDAGRMALKRALALEAGQKSTQPGFGEAATVFSEQHKEWGERTVSDADGRRRMRVNLRESPLTMLARKRGKDGKPFLSTGLVDAAERLREDFELSQMGPRVGQNWDRFLTGGQRGNFARGEGGLSAAQERFGRAMTALGPGLADIAMRCCCFLEGLETAEKRMGWSARSGKVVLRIALQRLRNHYDNDCDPGDRRIG